MTNATTQTKKKHRFNIKGVADAIAFGHSSDWDTPDLLDRKPKGTKIQADVDELKRILENCSFNPDPAQLAYDIIEPSGKEQREYYGRFAVDQGGRLYCYHNGVYTAKHAERYICQQVRKLNPGCKNSDCNEVLHHIKHVSPLLWRAKKLERFLNLRNGILDIHTCKLYSHTPGFRSNTQLAVAYDPDAECPAIEKFISEVFPKDAHVLGYEILAWIIFPELESIHKAILLYGEQHNGKSTYLQLLQRFISPDKEDEGDLTYSSLSLEEINDKFLGAELVGRLANINADLPSQRISKSSKFKKAVVHDSIEVQYKYGKPFSFVPHVKFLFSTNTYPQSADASQAFFNRWLVVPFEQLFKGKNETPAWKLKARLYQPKELSGMLNWALAIRQVLKDRNDFTSFAAMDKAHSEFRKNTDPIVGWLDENTICEPGAWVVSKEVYKAYRRSMITEGLGYATDTVFGKDVYEFAPTIKSGQRTINGRRQRTYEGIALLPT